MSVCGLLRSLMVELGWEGCDMPLPRLFSLCETIAGKLEAPRTGPGRLEGDQCT